MTALVGLGGWECDKEPEVSLWCGKIATYTFGQRGKYWRRTGPWRRESRTHRCLVNDQGPGPALVRYDSDPVTPGYRPLCALLKVRGWAADLGLYSHETHPCNMPQFKANRWFRDGVYLDPGVSGGWCRSIPRPNVDAVRCQHEQNSWVSSSTGWTYLPVYHEVHYVIAEPYEMMCGWVQDLGLYSAATSPCDYWAFINTVADGEGYYVDVGVQGGWCKKISAQNVAAVRSGYQQGQWHSSSTGVTYLPK